MSQFSGIMEYIQTMLRLVGGALRLDPAYFQAASEYSGDPTWLAFWIVFIAGVSLMLGQSVVLFANQVTPGRYVISIFFGAIRFVFDVIVVVIVVWGMANLLDEQSWGMGQIARGIALASAPYWLSIFILFPYVGIHLERLLLVYVFLALVTALQVIFSLGFGAAMLISAVALAVAIGVRSVIGIILSPISSKLSSAVVGEKEIASTREIYELYAQNKLIVDEKRGE